MIWENATYLWLLLLVPAFIVGEWYLRKYYARKNETYFSPELLASLTTATPPLLRKIRISLRYVAFTFLIIALAGPKIGMEIREVERDGVDLIVALDVSRSMLAQDVRPNRLDKARFEILRLMERLTGDRVGLVVFTSSAFFQVPLTNDYGAFRMFLDISSPELMSAQGTNFRNALRTSHEAFMDVRNQGSQAAQVLLFFSDGEDYGPDISEELAKFQEDGIFIYTVGIGTTDGANIPVFNQQTGELIDMHRDRQGRVVTTRLEPDIMRQMASATGGEYYEITRAAQGLDGFLNKLTQLERSAFATEELVDFRNQYQWFAGFAFFLLLIYAMLPSVFSNKD